VSAQDEIKRICHPAPRMGRGRRITWLANAYLHRLCILHHWQARFAVTRSEVEAVSWNPASRAFEEPRASVQACDTEGGWQATLDSAAQPAHRHRTGIALMTTTELASA
jgi:hypothetical protein